MDYDRDRGTGRTTQALRDAPQGAVYVWHNPHLDYPKSIARVWHREDLKVVSPEWLDGRRYRGQEIKAIVLDHACRLTNGEQTYYLEALGQVGRR